MAVNRETGFTSKNSWNGEGNMNPSLVVKAADRMHRVQPSDDEVVRNTAAPAQKEVVFSMDVVVTP